MSYLYDYLIGIAILITGVFLSFIFKKIKKFHIKDLNPATFRFALVLFSVIYPISISYYSYELGKNKHLEFNLLFLIMVILFGFNIISTLSDSFVDNVRDHLPCKNSKRNRNDS